MRLIKNTIVKYLSNYQDNIIPIQPTNLTATYVKIDIQKFILGEGFDCICYVFSDDKSIIQQKFVTIKGDDYNSWVDDNEMIKLILQKIGLSPLVPVV